MRQRPEFISLGVITKPHGIKGEVLVFPLTDDPDQFKKLKNLFISGIDGERELVTIERIRKKNSSLIIKFAGVNNRDQAEELIQSKIEKRLEDSEPLQPDEYYIFDLIGLNVLTETGENIGTVEDILTLPANDVYVVRKKSREVLIPAIKDVVKKIDLEEETILLNSLTV